MDTYFLFCLVAIVAVSSVRGELDPEMAEMARMLRDSCVGETNAEVDLIESVNKGADIPPDAKLKCYIKCVMETTGMLSDGEVEIETVLALIPEEFKKHTKTIVACGTKKGADDCDTAYLTQLCWQQGSKADYYLV